MKQIHLVLIGALGLLAGCDSRRLPSESSETLAMVGSREIRASDLLAEATRRSAAGLPVPSKEQLLEELVNREALLAEALKLGLDRESDLRRSWENQLIGRLKDQDLRPRLEQASIPADALAPEALEKPASGPAQLHLAILQFTTNRRLSDQRRAELLERMNEARQLAGRLPSDEPGFGSIAINFSDDQTSRYQGGDRGWIEVETSNPSLPAEVLAAANALTDIGALSEVVTTDRGIFLVRLLGRRASAEAALARREPARHQRLLREERQRIEREFLAGIRENVGVEIRQSALSALQFDPRPSANLASASPSRP